MSCLVAKYELPFSHLPGHLNLLSINIARKVLSILLWMKSIVINRLGRHFHPICAYLSRKSIKKIELYMRRAESYAFLYFFLVFDPLHIKLYTYQAFDYWSEALPPIDPTSFGLQLAKLPKTNRPKKVHKQLFLWPRSSSQISRCSNYFLKHVSIGQNGSYFTQSNCFILWVSTWDTLSSLKWVDGLCGFPFFIFKF